MILIILLIVFLVYLLLSPRGYVHYLPSAVPLYPGSDEEAALVRQRVANRTPDEAATFKLTDARVADGFKDIVPELDAQYLDYITGTHNLVILGLKYSINRPRPYQFHNGPALAEVLNSTSAHTPAFPSGHSYQAFLLADHLATLFPKRRTKLFEAAEAIGQSRIAAGHHFPSDHEFGRWLALTIRLPQ